MNVVFVLLPYLLTFLLPFIIILGFYEVGRGVLAVKRGRPHSRVATDFAAAVVMFGVVGLILYIGYDHHFPWFWLFEWIGDKV